ncbi:MAG: glycerol-3-phosphate dehydrogenase/oxidase [Flavobacteriales bacterium]|nr:glycerol-3-phosphate dehydrogenase/oxidase [Flavobacteriales bacterium]
MMNREQNLKELESKAFDLLVVGGGITGAGIALDAVLRGMKVALVERQDFAAGTSSRSTKLIHGGLRYLAQADFGLVYEVGRERRIVHALAPHLVHPDRMLLPLVEKGNYGYWLTLLGLSVYDLLAGVNKNDRKRMLSKNETMRLEPLLRTDILRGAGFYAEYRTDDARLTHAVLMTAAKHGAVVANYTAVEGFIYDNQKITGVEAVDEVSGRKFNVSSRHIVGAAGPWTDELRRKDESQSKSIIRHTKGVHLVIAREKLPVQHTVYFDNYDGRMLFAIPRDEKVYLGTTDTPYSGELTDPKVTLQDAEYVLEAVNAMFPMARLSKADVESSWAGIRPLIEQSGKSATAVSRKDEVYESDSGLIVIAGGKLTGYRKMAERVVDRVANKLGNKKSSTTEKVQLEGAGYINYNAVENHINLLMERWGHIILNQKTATYLVHTYGRAADGILELLPESGTNEEKLLSAEVQYCVRNEMVVTARDFYERRTARLFFDIGSLKSNGDFILSALARELGWDDGKISREAANLAKEIHRVTSFSVGE